MAENSQYITTLDVACIVFGRKQPQNRPLLQSMLQKMHGTHRYLF